MRIREVRLVSVRRARPYNTAARRRPSSIATTRRAFPISKYPEFSRDMGSIPGRSTARAWVQVVAENGQWGIGPCDWANLAAPVIEHHYGPLLLGRDCLATEFAGDVMWRSSLAFGPTGIASVARSAIDLALWDLKGKVLDCPVYSLLGGPSRTAVELYCTTDDLDWAQSLGFRAFKISNPVHYDEGSRGLDTIEKKVAQARETVGADAELMINPVMSFNVEFAARLAERLRPYNLRWIEEPLPPHDVEGHAALKAAFSPIPLATGEHLHGRHGFADLIAKRGADILQPDILWCGGLSEAVKVYTLAETAGLSTIPHFSGSTAYGVHFAYAMPECPMAEYFMTSEPGVPLDQAGGVPGTPIPQDGKVVPSDAPGFGWELADSDVDPWAGHDRSAARG